MIENQKVVFQKTTPAMNKIEFKKTLLCLLLINIIIIILLVKDFFIDSIIFSHYSTLIILDVILIPIALYFYYKSKINA